MAEPLDAALAEVRTLLLAPGLTRAVAAGRQRGETPALVRAEVRPVRVAGGTRLQVVTSDGSRPYTRNLAPGEAAAAVDALLAEGFGNWHVESLDGVLQLRVTKRGAAQVYRSRAPVATAAADAPAHDRVKEHLLDPGDPIFDVIGGSAAKRRQVDAFLRALAATLPGDADLPAVLRVVDLGCGNAYLTFAAYRYLIGRATTTTPGATTPGGSTPGAGREIEIHMVGVDVRDDQRQRNTALAERLGYASGLTFVAGTISDARLDPAPDVVLALHACDTATDAALARAVHHGARWLLAAPCCHHDIAAQLRRSPAPAPYGMLTRQPILRERFADVLTDALRAALLRLHGYHVDVVEFVASAHTPRNLMLRARYTGAPPTDAQRAEYAALTEGWGVVPALARLLTTRRE